VERYVTVNQRRNGPASRKEWPGPMDCRALGLNAPWACVRFRSPECGFSGIEHAPGQGPLAQVFFEHPKRTDSTSIVMDETRIVVYEERQS